MVSIAKGSPKKTGLIENSPFKRLNKVTRKKVTADAFGFASESEDVSDGDDAGHDVDGEGSVDEDEEVEKQMTLIKQL